MICALTKFMEQGTGAENVMSIYATHVTKGAMPTISVEFKSC